MFNLVSGKKQIPISSSSKCSNGADGESSYEIAVENGFVGTEAEWLASLVGAQGEPGPAGEGIVDVSSLTERTTPDQSNDWLVIWDTSASVYKKIKPIHFQQLFEAWSQTEEDAICASYQRDGFPIQVIRADLQSSSTFAIADSSSTSSAENIALSGSGGTFSIADLASVSSIDNVVLTMNGGTFSIADASSVSSADNIAISGSGTFSINDSMSSSSADSLSMALAGGQLTITDALSSASADNVAITLAGGSFAVADASSASSSENIALALAGGSFAVADASSASSEENVVLNDAVSFDFAGAADSAIPSFFDATTAGSGLVRIDGSGSCQIKSTVETDGSILWRKNSINLSQAKQYHAKLKVSTIGALFSKARFGILNATQKFSPNTPSIIASNYSVKDKIIIEILPSAGYLKLNVVLGNYDGSVWQSWCTTHSAWETSGAVGLTITNDTVYNLYIISNGTQIKVIVKNSDETSTLINTSYYTLSSLGTFSNTDYLYIGDNNISSNAQEILLDNYEEI